MSWGSFGEFLHMGGYGLYVWGAYSVTLVLLVIEAVLLASRQHTTIARLRRELQRSES
jgi:heme exporter protein D